MSLLDVWFVLHVFVPVQVAFLADAVFCICHGSGLCGAAMCFCVVLSCRLSLDVFFAILVFFFAWQTQAILFAVVPLTGS
jgi:hypothetical protein